MIDARDMLPGFGLWQSSDGMWLDPITQEVRKVKIIFGCSEDFVDMGMFPSPLYSVHCILQKPSGAFSVVQSESTEPSGFESLAVPERQLPESSWIGMKR